MKKLSLLACVLCIVSCGYGPESPRGFSLPEGNADRGKILFSKYRCIDCHAIAGDETKPTEEYLLGTPIVLGRSNGRVTTYGELVTGIINPSHKLSRRYPLSLVADKEGESKMDNINHVLIVEDLIDLVAYLQLQYKVKPYRTSEYRLYELRQPTSPDNH